MLFNKDVDEKEFTHLIAKVTPEEFIALAKMLEVKMSVINKETGEYALRDAEDILVDIVNAFRHLSHKERKLIIKVMKNGPSTKHK